MGIFILLLGVLALFYGISMVIKTKKKAAKYTGRAEGTVYEVKREHGIKAARRSKKIAMTIGFAFEANSEKVKSETIVLTTSEDEYKVGDTANILYNPVYPKEFVLDVKNSGKSTGLAFVFGAIGVALIAIGIVLTIKGESNNTYDAGIQILQML